MATLLREDQAVIHASVNGVNPPFSTAGWSALEWGDVEANNVKVFPGGMLQQQDLGGVQTRADATVTRPFSDTLHPYLSQWENVVGTATMRITYTPKDANGNPNGAPVTITGRLKKVTRPKYDANGNAAAMLGLVMSCNVATGQSQA